MKQNAITQAIGALKLVPIFVKNPAIVSRATIIRTSAEAVPLMETLSCITVTLAELHRCIDAVIADKQIAYVTPVNCSVYPYGAVVTDAEGNLLAAAKGKSKEGLAELIRLKLLPPREGHGESAA